MARSPKKPPAAKTLLRRYAGKLDEIRARYEAAAAEHQRAARRAESDYKLLAREYRREVGKLKKAGLIDSAVDVRKVRPTSSLSRLVNEFYDVVKGQSRAVRVEPGTAKKLKAEGFNTVRGRVVLKKGLTVRRGEVVEARPRTEGMEAGRTVSRIRLHGNLEAQIERIFSRLGADDYVAVDLGNNFARVFQRGEEDEFLNYLEGGGSFQPRSMSHVTIVRIPRGELNAYFKGKARAGMERAQTRKRKRNKQRLTDRPTKAQRDMMFSRHDKARLEQPGDVPVPRKRRGKRSPGDKRNRG